MALLALCAVYLIPWLRTTSIVETIWRFSLVTAIVLLAVGRFGIRVWPPHQQEVKAIALPPLPPAAFNIGRSRNNTFTGGSIDSMNIGDSENDVFKNMTIGDAKHRPITKNERVQFLALQGTDSKSIPMFLDEWRQLVESKDMPEDEKRREKDRAAGWIAKFTPLAGNPKKMRDALIKEQKRQQKLSH